jgi:hypothetical protein
MMDLLWSGHTTVAVADGRVPRFTCDVWQAFINGAKSGQFDPLDIENRERSPEVPSSGVSAC